MQFDINTLVNEVSKKDGIILYKQSDCSYVVKKGKIVITVYIRGEKIETQRVFIKENGSYIKKTIQENGNKIKEYRKLGESILKKYLSNKPLNNENKIIDDFLEIYAYSDCDIDIHISQLCKLKIYIEQAIKESKEDKRIRDFENATL